jgi:hypothetical protein
LPEQLALITYIKNEAQCSKFFTMPLGSIQSSSNEIILHNLLTEELEVIDATQILNVTHGPMTENSFLYKSFIKSKERFKSFKSVAEQINFDLNLVFAKLTNYPTLTFENKIPINILSSFLKTKTILPARYSNMVNLITEAPTGHLIDFILCCLFETDKLTVKLYKQHYEVLVNAYVNTEFSQLSAEWPALIKLFPELNKNEFMFTTKYLEEAANNSICRIHKIKDHQIKENWGKLVKISYNCWPKMLQPNPFRELIRL